MFVLVPVCPRYCMSCCFATVHARCKQATPPLPASFDNWDQALWALWVFVRLLFWHYFFSSMILTFARWALVPKTIIAAVKGKTPLWCRRLPRCSREPLHIPPCCTAFMQHGASWCGDVYLLSVLTHWCVSQLKCFYSDCETHCSPVFVKKISCSRKAAAAKKNSSSVLYRFLPRNITQLGQLL